MGDHHPTCPCIQAWDDPSAPCKCPPGWPRKVPSSEVKALTADDPLYREYPERRTVVDHYPMARGQVVVRWREYDEGDGAYIAEANLGGVIVEAGTFGFRDAQAAGRTLRRILAERSRLERERDEAVALLREREWYTTSPWTQMRTCPYCAGIDPAYRDVGGTGHLDDCRLGALLARLGAGGEED